MMIMLRAVGVLCGLLALSAAATVVASALNAPQPAWFLTLFELVILLACLWGMRAALGAPGAHDAAGHGVVVMTLVCVALCVFVGSVLGYVSVNGRVWDVSLRPHVYVRVGAAALIALVSALAALRHDWPRSVKRVLLGVAMVLPALLVAGLLYRGVGTARLAALPPFVRVGGACLGFVVWCGLLAAGVHAIFRGFEGSCAAARRSDGDAGEAISRAG